MNFVEFNTAGQGLHDSCDTWKLIRATMSSALPARVRDSDVRVRVQNHCIKMLQR